MTYHATMHIRLEYVAMLKVHGPRSGSNLELADDATVGRLLDALHIPPAHQRVIVPFVNERKARPEDALRDGDHVYLAMPVGGG